MSKVESLSEARPLTRNPLGQSHGDCDSCCSGGSCGGCSSCDSCQYIPRKVAEAGVVNEAKSGGHK